MVSSKDEDYEAGYVAGRIDANVDRSYTSNPGYSAAWWKGYKQAWADAGKPL